MIAYGRGVLGAVALVLLAGCAARRPATLGVRAVPGLPLGRPAEDSLRNVNGSPRIASPAMYRRTLARVAPVLDAAHDDPRLALDPNYLAALLVKESAGDTLAVSPAPALGVAQLTAVADSELRRLTGPPRPAWPSFAWMGAEAEAWPRDSRVHAAGVGAAAVDSLIAAGTLTSRTEYLLDPALAVRAASFWVRVLEARWTDDSLPGGYAAEARQRLAGTRPLSAAAVFALVTVSYNQGPLWVLDRVRRDGPAWTSRLDDGSTAGAEAADYLERVRVYVHVFRRAAMRR